MKSNQRSAGTLSCKALDLSRTLPYKRMPLSEFRLMFFSGRWGALYFTVEKQHVASLWVTESLKYLFPWKAAHTRNRTQGPEVGGTGEGNQQPNYSQVPGHAALQVLTLFTILEDNDITADIMFHSERSDSRCGGRFDSRNYSR